LISSSIDKPHLLHLGNEISRDVVAFGNQRLVRAQPLAHEAAHHLDQRVEGFGVERHLLLLSPSPSGEGL
jgi:hypothetical protein